MHAAAAHMNARTHARTHPHFGGFCLVLLVSYCSIYLSISPLTQPTGRLEPTQTLTPKRTNAGTSSRTHACTHFTAHPHPHPLSRAHMHTRTRTLERLHHTIKNDNNVSRWKRLFCVGCWQTFEKKNEPKKWRSFDSAKIKSKTENNSESTVKSDHRSATATLKAFHTFIIPGKWVHKTPHRLDFQQRWFKNFLVIKYCLGLFNFAAKPNIHYTFSWCSNKD